MPGGSRFPGSAKEFRRRSSRVSITAHRRSSNPAEALNSEPDDRARIMRSTDATEVSVLGKTLENGVSSMVGVPVAAFRRSKPLRGRGPLLEPRRRP